MFVGVCLCVFMCYVQGRLKHTMGPGQKKHMGPIIICIRY